MSPTHGDLKPCSKETKLLYAAAHDLLVNYVGRGWVGEDDRKALDKALLDFEVKHTRLGRSCHHGKKIYST